MGPSGSGKSTLLSLLTLTPTECKQSGNVTLNGHKVDSQLLRNFCSFVPQDDHLWPFLTCRETLSFAADFYLSKSSQEKKAEVDRLIKELGLDKCANTVCGNQFLKGLSGGQKRRLSLALALIKNPLVLFLDEPTSGLDSTSASWIMTFLNNYVKRRGVVVICTIHQPSTAIFKQFDSTMLLSGGRVAYVGPALEATKYFQESFQAAIPDDFSPAEFVLEFINSDFGDGKKKAEVDRVLDAWRGRAIVPARDQPKESLPTEGCRTTSFLMQVAAFVWNWRSPWRLFSAHPDRIIIIICFSSSNFC
jgi:ABC-type multidrug transport system ATPase subunit